jgi:uncharacterized iron-regulated membrane protein
MTVKAALFKLHRWVALAIGLWVGVTAFSGTILAFRSEIEGLLRPHTYLVDAAPKSVNFDKIVATVSARYPDRQIIAFRRDGRRPDEAFRVRLTRAADGDPVDLQNPKFNLDGDANLEVFVDPESGKILGDRPYWNWMQTIFSLHIELLTPAGGKSYLGILGALLFFLAVSGLIIWWPRQGRFWKSFQISAKGGKRRLLRDLHTVGGSIIVTLLMLSCLTGFYMCYEGDFQRFFRQIGIAKATMVHTPVAPSSEIAVSVQNAVDAAMALYPDADPVLIERPTRGRAQYMVQLFPRHESRAFYTVEAHVSAITGEIVSVFDPHTQPVANASVLWIIFLHNGQMLGKVGQFIVMCLGATLTMLSVTGIWMWLIKKRNGFARKRAARTVSISGQGHPVLVQHRSLPLRHGRDIEIRDQILE